MLQLRRLVPHKCITQHLSLKELFLIIHTLVCNPYAESNKQQTLQNGENTRTFMNGLELLLRDYKIGDIIEYDSDPNKTNPDDKSHVHKGKIVKIQDITWLDCLYIDLPNTKIMLKHLNSNVYKNYLLYEINIKLGGNQQLNKLPSASVTSIHVYTKFDKYILSKPKFEELTQAQGESLQNLKPNIRRAIAYELLMDQLDRPEIADFIFKQTNIWRVLICEWKAHPIYSQPAKSVKKYRLLPMMVLLFGRILSSVTLLNNIHWRQIFGINWFNFIEPQLKTNNDTSELELTLHCFILLALLVCIGLHEKNKDIYSSFWYDLEKILKNLDLIKPKLYRIRKMFKNHKEVFRKAENLFSLLDVLKNNVQRKMMINSIWVQVHNDYTVRWRNMMCHNSKCAIQRKCTKHSKLYKCKSCRITRYCSKQCQKIDWNRNNHKKYCKKISRLRKRSSLFFFYKLTSEQFRSLNVSVN
eukprot:346511_1